MTAKRSGWFGGTYLQQFDKTVTVSHDQGSGGIIHSDPKKLYDMLANALTLAEQRGREEAQRDIRQALGIKEEGHAD